MFEHSLSNLVKVVFFFLKKNHFVLTFFLVNMLFVLQFFIFVIVKVFILILEC